MVSANRVLDPSVVAATIEEAYELQGPPTAELLREGFNHNYRVSAGPDRFVFRVYLDGKYYIQDEGDFAFELELLDFLGSKGLRVAEAIRRRDGRLLGALRHEQVTRSCALFRWVDGTAPETFDGDLASGLGDLTGAMHAAMDDFQSVHHRYRLDLRYLCDDPMRDMRAVADQRGIDLAPHGALVAVLRKAVAAVAASPPAFGLIHADLNPSNILVDDDGTITLIDFDHSGYGWRAYDLATLRLGTDAAGWSRLLDAYSQHRELTGPEQQSIPALAAMRLIWDQGDVLAMLPAWGKVPGEEWDQLPRLFEQVAEVYEHLQAS